MMQAATVFRLNSVAIFSKAAASRIFFGPHQLFVRSTREDGVVLLIELLDEPSMRLEEQISFLQCYHTLGLCNFLLYRAMRWRSE